VLGLFDDAAFATERGPDLRAGDLLALFTDGVTEAEAADGTMCGAEWALDVVRARAHLCSAEILDALCDAIRTITGGGSQQDDITAIVCRIGKLEPPGPGARQYGCQKGAATSRARVGPGRRGSTRTRTS